LTEPSRTVRTFWRRLAIAAGMIGLVVGTCAGFLLGRRDARVAGAPIQDARSPTRASGPVHPNIVLILIDTLRADHLGCYGYARRTSPTIDRLAAEGAMFEQAIASSSWTVPSTMSLLSSLYEPVHGVDSLQSRYALAHPLLAEVLARAGYKTAGFFAGDTLHPMFGFDRGFDTYSDCRSGGEMTLEDVANPRVHGAVTRWFEERLQEPFFVFAHYFDIHQAYVPPPPYDTMFDPAFAEPFQQVIRSDGRPDPDLTPRGLEHLIALYDGEIRWTDQWIDQLLDLLRTRGVLDRTLIVLTSDHGEEFGEHGWAYHGHTLHDESVRVPLMVRMPGIVPPGLRIPAQVRLVDVYPTILSLAGVEAPAEIVGRNLAPLVLGRQRALDLPPAFSFLHPYLRSIRLPDLKVIEALPGGEAVLYDLTRDPGEQAFLDVAASGRGIRAQRELREFVQGLDEKKASMERTGSGSLETDADSLKRLRSLGYVR
jgi:arylsulfatase A-like enzyme